MDVASVEVKVEGVEAAATALNRYAERMRSGIGRGLERGGLMIVGSAKALCPVSTEKTRPGGPHGELRASIEHQVLAGLRLEVGTNKEYGIYVELGTRKMAAQPFLMPALVENIREVLSTLESEMKSS